MKTSRRAKPCALADEKGLIGARVVQRILDISHQQLTQLINSPTAGFPKPITFGPEPGKGWRFFQRHEFLQWLAAQTNKAA